MDGIIEHAPSVRCYEQLGKEVFMDMREMAEAHLKNVDNQIQELHQQRARIEADIQQLSDYLQQGVAELNSGNNQTAPVPPPDRMDVTMNSAAQSMAQSPTPNLTLPLPEGQS